MNRSLLLDLLRIFAISLVFVAHFGQLLDGSAGNFFGVKNFYYVSLGGVGVSLFLLLSGILAGLGDSGKSGFVSYFLKKILRIYPLYLMSIPLAILGYFLGIWLLEGSPPELFPNGFLADLFGSVTGFYSWMGLWGGPYNSPSWFIALILTMYAMFPFIFFLMKKQPHLVIVILFLVSAVSRYYVGKEGVPFVDQSFFDDLKGWFYRQYGFMPGRPGDWFPPCRVFEFALGIYLALVIPRELWFKLRLAVLEKPIQFLSDLAFPLFLIHYPYMFLVLYFADIGLPLSLSIVGVIAMLVVVAYFISVLDAGVPRKRIMLLLSKNNASQ